MDHHGKDGGTRLIGTGFEDSSVSIELDVVPEIAGRYIGAPVPPIPDGDFRFIWQLETDELIWSVLVGELDVGAAACPFTRGTLLVYLGP